MNLIKKVFIILIWVTLMVLAINNINYAESSDFIYINHNYMLFDVYHKIDQYETIKFFDNEDNLIEDWGMLIKTGVIVECTDENDNTISFKTAVKGDVNGDGYVDKEDTYCIKADIVGLIDLESAFLKAADSNDDTDISLYDLVSNKQLIQNSSDEPKEELSIEVSEVRLNLENINLEIGETSQLVATIFPEIATDKQVMYISENENIAEIDENGKITAKGNGTTKVYATTSSGVTATCNVTVNTTPEAITINEDKVNLYINGNSSYDLEVSYDPITSNIMKDLSWNTSDSNIVTVDEKGLITAVANGSAIITATTQNNLQATCSVTVYTIPNLLTLPKNLEMELGTRTTIDCSIEPNTSNYNTEISWYSDAKNIVTISEDGLIVAKNPGTATITAETANGIKSTCIVTVLPKITDVIFNESFTILDLSMNDTYQILAKSDLGTDITNSITWSSKDEKIAIVTDTGMVKAVANGTTTIEGTFLNIKKTFEVTVHTSPEKLELVDKSIFLNVGEEKNLEYIIEPNDTDINNTITWTTTNSSILNVDGNGKIIANSAGRAIVKVQTGINNNLFDTCIVNVVDIPSNMYFQQNKLLLKQDEQKEIILTLNEDVEDINLEDLKITSSSEEILRYTYEPSDENSKQIKINIQGLKKGATNIIAQIGEVSTSCEIIVYNDDSVINLCEANGDILNNSNQNIQLDTNRLLVNIYAKLDNIYDVTEDVEWKSNDETKATVDSFGVITIKDAGEVIISAELEGKIESFTLKIEILPRTITMRQQNVALSINQYSTTQLSPVITPSNCSNTDIKYLSSDENVVTVDDNGVLIAKSAGEAIITATTVNNISATCRVIVNVAPTEVKFDAESMYLKLGGTVTLNPTILPANSNVYNNLTWSSDNEVISIDQYGNIKALQPGSATIAVSTQNGKTDFINVIVPELSLKASSTSLDLSKNNKTTIVDNGSSDIGKLTYAVSDSTKASVDNNGNITGKANGNVNIIVTESNAGTTITIPIKITTSTTSVQLNQTNVSLDINNTSYKLTATQQPSTVSIKGVTWKSSNTNVVTVNNGTITRVGSGTATITATANDGSGKVGTCTVKVKKEKLIIVGASTMCQIASTRKVSATADDRWNPDYLTNYGYTIRKIGSYHDYLGSKAASSDKDADLYFVCKSGSGYYWLAGEEGLPDYYSENGTKGAGQERLFEILNNTNNNSNDCHFTIAFLTGGNDLVKTTTKAQVDEIASRYVKYYKGIADKYPQHTVYAFPVTPVDLDNVKDGAELKKTGYNVKQSNNTKRYRFACQLNAAINNNESNLKYTNGFYNDLKDDDEYAAYDGKHFTRKGTKHVFEKMLNYMSLLNSNGKKK